MKKDPSVGACYIEGEINLKIVVGKWRQSCSAAIGEETQLGRASGPVIFLRDNTVYREKSLVSTPPSHTQVPNFHLPPPVPPRFTTLHSLFLFL